MEQFNIYGEEFSRVYDGFWKDFIVDIGPQIQVIYSKYTKNEFANPYVLDLCCGTGRLSKLLCEQGFKVVGLDKSTSMLKVAVQKLTAEIKIGQAKFIEGLAQQFSLNEKFDLIVSTFDSINHLSNIGEVKACFTNVFNHLKKTGCFIFDLNTKEVLKNWNFVDLDESDDKSITYIMHGKYNIGEDKAYTRVIGFIDKQGDGNYKRFDEIMFNSLFDLSEITTLLREVGFSNYVIYDSLLLNIISDSEPIKDRVFIIAF